SNARIMSYGYDSVVAFSKSVAGIEDFAADLISRVSDERQSIKKIRPIVFICHSVGGIVFKKALILAHQRSSTFSKVLESVTGIIILGTPHRGSNAAYWKGFTARALKAAQLGTRTMDQLLAAVQKNSRTLSDISEQFVERTVTLQIRTFYETEKLDFMSSLADSARLHIPNEKLPIPIQANHTTMCKFSHKNSQKYSPVWKAVRELLELSRSGREIQAPSDNGGPSPTAGAKDSRWLLVFDNVEDAEHLEPYRPKSEKGSILITTRKPNIGYELTDSELVVGPFSPQEGTKFVLRLATWQNNAKKDTQSAAELNEKLGGLPLGITQMVALMCAKAVSLQVFLKLYEQKKKEWHGLFRRGGRHVGYKEDISTAWQLSFRSLDDSAHARSLLGVLCFLSPSSISQSIFRIGTSESSSSSLKFCQDWK
ncbi:MAG: hypothetical protein Q9181_008196, partial [Wetmoreana brouardii]